MPGSLLPRSRESMHADETAQFRSPYQPNAGDDVKLRLRIGREDTPNVWLIMDGRGDVPMKRVGEDSHFAYYEAQTDQCGLRRGVGAPDLYSDGQCDVYDGAGEASDHAGDV